MGGIDGVINATVILLTGYSANAPVDKLFALVFSATVVGAFDMALGDYISSKSEISFIAAQQAREMYQVQHLLKEQMRQMLTIYVEKGYSQAEAYRLVELISTNKQVLTDTMMMWELGLVKVEDSEMSVKCGIATFFAFLTTGMIALSPYIFTWCVLGSTGHPWPFVLLFSGATLLSLGFAKGRLLGLDPWTAGIQFVGLGAAGTIIGFLIGKAFQNE